MQAGLSLPNGGPWGDARSLAELSRFAEDAGWDGVFLEDYIIWQNHQDVPTYDPWVALAAIALRTDRLKLGTSVTPLTRRRPWKVAREAVTLDHLSHGRMVLGVGLGDTGESIGADASFTHFAEVFPPKVRAEMLDEALAILAGLWTGQPFAFSGQHYQVKETTFLPRPVQLPAEPSRRIPIWVGGGFPLKGPTRRAARWDGSFLYRAQGHFLQPDDIRALQAIVREERGTLEGYDIAVGGSPRDPDTGQQRAYMQSLAEVGVTWFVEYIPPDTGDFETARAHVAGGPLRLA